MACIGVPASSSILALPFAATADATWLEQWSWGKSKRWPQLLEQPPPQLLLQALCRVLRLTIVFV